MAKKIAKWLQAKFSAPVATDQGEVTTVIGGESTAIGQDTLAQGDVSLTVKDHGRVTIIRGTASFGAAAESTDGSTAYATADSFADVSGADIVRTRTKTASQSSQDGDTSTWIETSTTRVFAIDIEGRTLPRGAAALSKDMRKTGGAPDRDDFDLDGNVATVQADILIEGENTYAGTDTSVLAVEDTLSTVSVFVTTGIA